MPEIDRVWQKMNTGKNLERFSRFFFLYRHLQRSGFFQCHLMQYVFHKHGEHHSFTEESNKEQLLVISNCSSNWNLAAGGR